MGRYNLLDEAWISVIIDDKGHSKEVSLKELFKNAHLYRDLAGDTRTQDFVILRVILAVIYTVFSRFNYNGEPYEYFDIDEKYSQVSSVDEEDLEPYLDEMLDTWKKVWNTAKFPEIINEYLEIWRDRFNLFDKQYPFFQIVKDDIKDIIDLKKDAGKVHGKNINRKLSESANKVALFSYKYNQNNNKEMLSEQEIVRWLLTYQGYSGTGDKAKFPSDIKTFSKGWLYDLGGVYLKGSNLFETLMLNWAILYNGNRNDSIQKPCWEYSSKEIISSYTNGEVVNNVAALYTAWSRGIYIDPEHKTTEPFYFRVVKLPEIEHRDAFVEPMTIWKYNEKGNYKDSFIPIKHRLNESMWRSFGLLSLPQELKGNTNIRIPGIIQWIEKLDQIEDFPEVDITLVATSMEDDGNATSWVPTNEIVDSLSISNYVLTDLEEDGWVIRINDIIELTKSIIDVTYRKYIESIQKIRNISNNIFVDKKVEDLYYIIDLPFRNWISSIRLEEKKDEKVLEWKKTIEKYVKDQAKEDIYYANYRDYIGIEKDKEIFNIAKAYNKFNYFLNLKLNN